MNLLKRIMCGSLMFAVVWVQAQSPHGETLKISCDACHTAESWAISRDSISFDHHTTRFSLEGQHEVIDCRQCHATLEFSKAETNCTSCHIDIHQESVGQECARCHDSNSWLVNNIAEIHRQISFPLLGAHATADCIDCHKSETSLRFEPMATECLSCHQQEYEATTNPDHKKAGFSTDCIECHKIDAFEWSASGINHDFFPLTQGHDIDECAQCHTGTDYSKISPECITCHEANFLATTNPNHQLASISTSCVDCHTTQPGWKPAEFEQHDDQYFPIYSGSHEGEWDNCVDCHTDQSNYAIFTCITCHQNPETNDEHDEVQGYSYSNTACLACHPNGEAEGAFDHNNTNFPLTGEHTTVECLSCHASGFTGTPTACFACHEVDFNQSLNPNHTTLGLSTDCASCHTTAPDWNPATFANHNDYYVLTGAHAIIANQCASCHQGEYNNTPTTCIGCHLQDYNQTTDPNHVALQFSTECTMCHSENAWVPATFDHDDAYFPIYSGSHEGEWSQCIDCHTTPGNFGEFTCITCHTNPETTEQHNGVSGYAYNSQACFACHPNGEGEGGFDHNATNFPLTGAHTTTECGSCHANGFEGTPTECQACHATDFNQSVNPNHSALGFSNDCASCHTTQPGWSPATLDNHNDYYVLSGAHAIVASQCASCHNGDYNNTPNTCAGCHIQDYNQTVNPSHLTLQFSQDCATCHSESAWVPSTFDHDNQYFPIYSGSHEGEWSQCSECHTTPGNWSQFTCTTCHMPSETDEDHQGVNGYVYNSTACLACHPTGEGDVNFNHNATNFPLTGAHTVTNCLECHATGFEGTSTECQSCHMEQYNQSLNPNHVALGIQTDCASCHSTEPGWSPATFLNHNDYYALNGAHAIIASQCASCHNGDYNNTPNTCTGCHLEDFNQTVNPPHVTLQFSQDCATCHSETTWVPATFDHDNQYFPIYSGSHEGEWAQCTDCHTTPGVWSQFTCTTCHMPTETDEDHDGVNGYVYNSSACLACHPTGEGDVNFDHNATNFPLTGAHTVTNCLECHATGYEGTSTECQSCHIEQYNQSLNPNHVALGIQTDCASCHSTEPGWSPATFLIHNDYYALNGAHAIIASQCASCHNGDYNNTPNTCTGCHLDDYNQTVNPPHVTLQFSQDCATCHSETAWVPATFDHDNQYFPIYSGSHEGEWAQCTDCHTTPGVWSQFTCITCHMPTETDEDHNGVNGYVYNSSACLACHPTGEGEVNFDHNATNFPLTGAHTAINCLECHASGYEGTPTECVACHTGDFNGSVNPNHVALGIPTDCASCHTTVPNWNPATFDIHNQYYALNGAHAIIASQCVTCHNGDYNNTPNTCVGCHQDNYNQTTNPSHTALQLSTDCASCHTESTWMPANFPNHNDFYVLEGAHAVIANDCVLCHNGDYNNTPNTCVGCHLDTYNETTNPSHIAAGFGTDCASCHSQNTWTPATFNHDAQYFPIYSGEHLGVWDQCNECHTNPNDFSVFTCVTCHSNPETNQQHSGVSGYVYESNACLACHPTGDVEGAFDHNNSDFPLTGAHVGVDCISCHSAGYEGTPTACDACHMPDYNQSTNPNHNALDIPTNCVSCHTTAPGWSPATFDIHNEYYALNGAHAAIANQCATCHNGNYNNTPNTCVGCHQSDYNQTDNPSHSALNFSTDCASCHTESAWSPAEYTDHDDQFFPIYSGGHEGAWDQCNDCHTNPNNYSIYTCITCHTASETNPQHNGVNGYVYQNSACLACHPTGDAAGAFDHDESNFPLTGAHQSVSCIECHASGYEGTPTDCNACHLPDYNQTSNPNHQSLNLSTDCATCHTTAPNWNPALFPNHNDYYPLLGAHAAIANQCATCHNGNYNNTPNTCVGCHLTDYNQTDDPDHQAANFPTTCTDCHSQNAWSPANWDHDDQYFPIYSGQHEGEWDQCNDCHTNPNNYSVFTCITCHEQGETADDHDEVNGYQYNSNACLACHPNGEAD